ncbi:hypothetical protein [Stenotrophomonas forensis]
MEFLKAVWAIVGIILASALTQTLLGGLISAWAASRTVDRQMSADREIREDEAKDQLKSLASAIKLELETIRGIHQDGVGAELEECRESGAYFDSYYPIYSDYFTLFTGNAGAIGRAPAHVAQAVVQAYIHLKALVDTFRFNNAMLDRVEDFLLRGVPETDERLVDLVEQLGSYTPKIIESHDRAMSSVNKALDALDGV